MAIAAEDDAIRIEKLTLGTYGTNAYMLICRQTGDSVVVDAPAEAGTIAGRLEGSKPRYILLTHSHMDHILALAELRSKLGIPLAAHTADSANLPLPPDSLLNDGDIISFGKIRLEVMHTPGHTPGSLCFRTGKYLISGDTIFPGGPGKTKSPDDFRQIVQSITGRIFILDDETRIFPGHGDSTILKKEKAQFAVFSSRPHDHGLCEDVLWLSAR